VRWRAVCYSVCWRLEGELCLPEVLEVMRRVLLGKLTSIAVVFSLRSTTVYEFWDVGTAGAAYRLEEDQQIMVPQVQPLRGIERE
jgi:hypothetical protein